MKITERKRIFFRFLVLLFRFFVLFVILMISVMCENENLFVVAIAFSIVSAALGVIQFFSKIKYCYKCRRLADYLGKRAEVFSMGGDAASFLLFECSVCRIKFEREGFETIALPEWPFVIKHIKPLKY